SLETWHLFSQVAPRSYLADAEGSFYNRKEWTSSVDTSKPEPSYMTSTEGALIDHPAQASSTVEPGLKISSKPRKTVPLLMGTRTRAGRLSKPLDRLNL
ncbi:hypothetical protein XENOCAPTIV_017371, partial [Xenoophorus captivus]